MKPILFFALALALPQFCLGQLGPADLNGFQRLLESTTANPLRECADAGLRKLYIYRAIQAAKTPDAEVAAGQLTDVTDDGTRAQLKNEIELWTQTRSSATVAQSKFDACLRQLSLPTSEPLGRLTRHCFGNALFAIDIQQAKHVKQPVEEIKAKMKRAKTPLPEDKVDAFITEMFGSSSQAEEEALTRELFSSCIGANNGRF
jgi:hypothetical protein